MLLLLVISLRIFSTHPVAQDELIEFQSNTLIRLFLRRADNQL